MQPEYWDGVQRERLARVLTFLTPIQYCVVVIPGPVSAVTLRRLESSGYDQAPVIGPKNTPIGTVPTEYLRTLYQSAILSQGDPCINRTVIPTNIKLSSFLADLTGNSAVLVKGQLGECLGLITIADLNRHSFRATIHELLSELESAIAYIIESNYHNPMSWILKLAQIEQDRIVALWSDSLQNNLDIGTTHAATFHQMRKAIWSSKLCLNDLGYESKRQFKDDTYMLDRIRNNIMHPVRNLIQTPEDISVLTKSVDKAEVLIKMAHKVRKDRNTN